MQTKLITYPLSEFEISRVNYKNVMSVQLRQGRFCYVNFFSRQAMVKHLLKVVTFLQ